MSTQITVEVVYALRDQQIILPLQVEPGTTAARAIELSGVLQKYPEINLEQNKIGIFGRLIKADTALRDKDRVEIYRPLLADPKEVRRKRAEEGKAMKKGGGSLEG